MEAVGLMFGFYSLIGMFVGVMIGLHCIKKDGDGLGSMSFFFLALCFVGGMLGWPVMLYNYLKKPK